ncbi:hypothetical protein C5B85_06190, partial [Pseudoclavibacter sp. AY1F1]
DLDPIFVPHVLNELVHSPTQFVHTSGIWLFGDSGAERDDSGGERMLRPGTQKGPGCVHPGPFFSESA